ncbi:MAG: hypothetical protein R2792_03465 [Saprospiraceae bacterium]|jgi:hypothetical protein
MKTWKLLSFAAFILFMSSCEQDPYPLEVEYFDKYWIDLDGSNSHTPFDEIEFDIRINTTDPDPEDQFITEWELSYFVNDTYGGLLDGAENIGTNTLNVNAVIGIEFLNFPGPGTFQPGDRIEFRFWAIDNHGTQVERYYDYFLE